MEVLQSIFALLVFPGFLFTAAGGMAASFFDRKLSARFQWRVGPPWFQPAADVLKLLGKETIVPAGVSRAAFLLSPLAGFAAAVVAALIIWKGILAPGGASAGDLIVVLYLLTVPATAVIVGGFASSNPLASLGASREMKLLLSYELPFLLAALVPVIKAGSIRLGEIVLFQGEHGVFLGSVSGLIAFLVLLLCQQAKLTLAPFDLPDAETEISGGVFMEYSGTPLALFRLTRMMLLFTLPVFLVALFWGGIGTTAGGILAGVGKVVLILFLAIVIKNTNPRVRIDQAMRFFWGPVAGLAIVAVVLALLGL
jgi:NADH-quinone oxidoreductase subunit H